MVKEYPRDIIVSSKRLQQFFRDRCIELEVKPEHVSKKAGVEYKKVRQWFEAIDHDTCTIKQSEVIALFRVMYVDITMTIGVLPVENMDEEKFNELRRIEG